MNAWLILKLRKHWPTLLSVALLLLVNFACFWWGKLDERGIWKLSEAQRQIQEEKSKLASSEAARKIEADHAETFATIDRSEQPKLKDIDDGKDRIITALRADNQRLSVRIYSQSTTQKCEAGAGASMGYGETRAELHPETAGDLVSEASLCDKIVVQLGAAQQLLNEDRRVVNEYH